MLVYIGMLWTSFLNHTPPVISLQIETVTFSFQTTVKNVATWDFQLFMASEYDISFQLGSGQMCFQVYMYMRKDTREGSYHDNIFDLVNVCTGVGTTTL